MHPDIDNHRQFVGAECGPRGCDEGWRGRGDEIATDIVVAPFLAPSPREILAVAERSHA